MIQKFYNDLERVHKLKGKTAHAIHGVLSRCLTVAVKNDALNSNPCQKVTPPKIQKYRFEPLTDYELSLFVRECEKLDNVYGYTMKFMLFTGVRKGEALGLSWNAIDS